MNRAEVWLCDMLVDGSEFSFAIVSIKFSFIFLGELEIWIHDLNFEGLFITKTIKQLN